MRVDLAEEAGEGSAWLCSGCDDVHMRWQNWMVTLTREQFSKMARMASAAEQKLSKEPATDRKSPPQPQARSWFH